MNRIEEIMKQNTTPDIPKDNFFEKYPEFTDFLDDEGLFEFDLLKNKYLSRCSNYWVYYWDYFIHFHNLWWLNVNERVNCNRFFIMNFYKCYRKYWDTCKFKIKLDFDKIIHKDKYSEVFLMSTWYGPPYIEDKLFINKNDSPLPIRYKRTNSKFDEYMKNNIFFTDFLLDNKNNSYQIEEIWENLYNWLIANRFIHTEFNIEEKKIKHFDGSILLYDTDLYENRKEVNLLHNKKINKDKIKLFKIDWKIEVEDRQDLILTFFINNEMLLEYFDKESYKKLYSHILDYENWIDI